jgi:tripartite-type tricarboxylate transporter receptor subunit TctC
MVDKTIIEELAPTGVLRAAINMGNMLLVTTAALPINETLYRNKGFLGTSLKPISIVATTPEVFAIGKADPAKSLAEFVASQKDKEIIFATAGIGTGSHIAGEYFFKFIAILLLHVVIVLSCLNLNRFRL